MSQGNSDQKPRGPGRYSILKIRPNLQKDICNQLQLGLPVETALAFVGLPYSTFYDLLAKGRRADPQSTNEDEVLYYQFAEAVAKARAAAEIERVQRIRRAGMGGDVIKTITRWVPQIDEKTGKPKIDLNTGEPILIKEVVEEKARPNWQADAWWLERRMPEKYGQRTHLDVGVNPREMSDAELLATIEGAFRDLGPAIEGEAREISGDGGGGPEPGHQPALPPPAEPERASGRDRRRRKPPVDPAERPPELGL